MTIPPEDVIEDMREAYIEGSKNTCKLKDRGGTLKRSALAFDWHDRPYYGSPVTEGVRGTKPKAGPATGK